MSSARADRLLELGADPQDLPALLAYTESPYATDAAATLSQLPLPDEPHVAVWREYARAARTEGAVPVLARALVQLGFPIAAGMSQADAYRASTRRGEPAPADSTRCAFVDPDGVEIRVHEAPAGGVPVVVARARADFVTLVRALSARNEPEPVPDSMGALFVAGYNNWDRVRRYRMEWERGGSADADWPDEFKRLIPRKELYQDRFILVSTGPYSGVAAGELGLAEREWAELSAAIRIEHEATHHFTRRMFGVMRTNLLDEILADTMGLVFATGRFRADWLLRFLGLERYPEYRAGGRFENYLGEIDPHGSAARALRRIVHEAVSTLGGLAALRDARTERAKILAALCRFDLLDLSAQGAADRIEEVLTPG